MTFEEYIPLAMKTAVFKDPLYPYASLLVESAELLDVFVKPLLRGDNGGVVDRDKVIKEAGDCLWNLAAICRDQGESTSRLQTPETHYNRDDILTQGLKLLDNANDVIRMKLSGHPVDITTLSWDTTYRIAWLLNSVNATLSEAMELNIQKLRSRAERGVLLGSGGER